MGTKEVYATFPDGTERKVETKIGGGIKTKNGLPVFDSDYKGAQANASFE